jgi:hypothetical protein
MATTVAPEVATSDALSRTLRRLVVAQRTWPFRRFNPIDRFRCPGYRPAACRDNSLLVPLILCVKEKYLP